MRVSVRLFAGLRERAGTARLEVADVARVGDVWPKLGLGAEPPGLLYAVNREYAGPDVALHDGDEVALIPPVSGGAFRISAAPLDLGAAVAEAASDEAGAVATFVGTVRRSSRGRDVLYLEWDGEDLTIQVPVGTVVLESATGESLWDFEAPGQRFLAARGGRGGRGNAQFATSTHQAPRKAELGRKGEARDLKLELKLLADVGLVANLVHPRGLRTRGGVPGGRAMGP